MFRISTGVVVTQVYMFVKTHPVARSKSIHLTDWKCAEKKNLISYKPYFAQEAK